MTYHAPAATPSAWSEPLSCTAWGIYWAGPTQHPATILFGNTMNTKPLIDEMNRELSAASPDLVGNDALLQGVLAGCGDCIKVLDLEGRLQFMSDGGKRVMEVDDFSALKGCPWPEFWAGEGNREAVAAIEAAKAGKTARFRAAANTAKGTPRYWEVRVSPILDENGETSHLLSISADITEEWEAEKREQFLIEELEHRAKNSFAMVLSIANQTFRGDSCVRTQSLHNAYRCTRYSKSSGAGVELDEPIDRRSNRNSHGAARKWSGKNQIFRSESESRSEAGFIADARHE